jgi:hypothetical protein
MWKESLAFTTSSAHSTTLQNTASGPAWSQSSISFHGREADFLSANFWSCLVPILDFLSWPGSRLSLCQLFHPFEIKSCSCAGLGMVAQSLLFKSSIGLVRQHGSNPLSEAVWLARNLSGSFAERDRPSYCCHDAAVPAHDHPRQCHSVWENLCGYTKAEAVHGSLSLIQGPDWNRERAEPIEHMMQRVVETFQPQETVLINYSKPKPYTAVCRSFKAPTGTESGRSQ